MVEELGISADSVRAAEWRDFVNAEYAWVLDCRVEQLPQVVKRFEVTPLAPADVPTRFYARFPTSWRPALATGGTYYATPGFPVDSTFGGPEHVLKYLARYTHRVAISNGRLVSLEGGKVTFRWKDYADHSRKKLMIMTLDAVEFIRRFLLHREVHRADAVGEDAAVPDADEAGRNDVAVVSCSTHGPPKPPDPLPPAARTCIAATPAARASGFIERFERPSLAALLSAAATPFDDTS